MLKAGIRSGVTTDGWAHEALALALQGGKAVPAEVERAALSAIDLEPTDAKALPEGGEGRRRDSAGTELALAFCQRAATLEPNLAGRLRQRPGLRREGDRREARRGPLGAATTCSAATGRRRHRLPRRDQGPGRTRSPRSSTPPAATDEAERAPRPLDRREDPRPGHRTALAGRRPTSTWS